MRQNDWNIKHENSLITDINITPLTDVMLVLLIIFMVTATFFIAEPSMKVNLPPAVTSTRKAETSGEITVTINEQGHMLMGGRPVRPADLVNALMSAARKLPQPQKVVVIRADKKASYGSVIWVMDAARLVGLHHVSLATEEINSRDARQQRGVYTQSKSKDR
ncbi:MAG: biopolymer transporter ExbD [Armatimonadetes bacterium]|nr:biopolymer transporter ExbD [Armatimonadota bacterium]